MKKLLSSVFFFVITVLAFSSCVYYVDRPYVYTGAAPQTQFPEDTNYSYGYNSNQAYGFVILRIYDNRYIFYDNNTEIAVWIFQTNGTVIKRGRVINGLVKMFYAPEIPAAEILYRNNERDGYCRFYHRNGRPMEFGEYRNGLRYGNWKRFNDSGAIDEEFAFDGDKITYKQRAKASSKKTSQWEFDYLNREHEYKKRVNQDFNDKDIYPPKYKKVFGENPYENDGKKDVSPVNKDRDDKNRKDDGQRGNAYGRDTDKDRNENKWRNDKSGRGNERPAVEPAHENTPAAEPFDRPGRGNDGENNGRDNDDKRGNAGQKGNTYGFENNKRPADEARENEKNNNAMDRDAVSDEPKVKAPDVKKTGERAEPADKETPVNKNRFKSDRLPGLKGKKADMAQDVTTTAEEEQAYDQDETGRADEDNMNKESRVNAVGIEEDNNVENKDKRKPGRNKVRD